MCANAIFIVYEYVISIVYEYVMSIVRSVGVDLLAEYQAVGPASVRMSDLLYTYVIFLPYKYQKVFICEYGNRLYKDLLAVNQAVGPVRVRICHKTFRTRHI